MPHDDQWITTLIAETHKNNPLLTEAVLARIGPLLKSKLNEGPLSSVQLTEVAKMLIADMVPASPKMETTK